MNLTRVAGYLVLIWLPLACGAQPGRHADVDDDGDGSVRRSPDPAPVSAKGDDSPSGTTVTIVNRNNSSALVVDDPGGVESDLKAKAVSASYPDNRKTRLRYPSGWIRKRKRRKKREAQGQGATTVAVDEDEYEEEEDEAGGDDNDEEINPDDLDNEDVDDTNTTELGRYLGSPCETKCSSKLVHVFCDPVHRTCECERKYPVQIGVRRGCAKPKQLEDQCFYTQTCSFTDPNAICMQINHNAICQCKPGFHSVALRRGAKRSFCSEDQVVVSADLPTLLGVASGIAVLTGLICFVLKLFNSNRYPDRRRYNNANMAPPLLFPSDNQWINGIPLTVHGRPSSRTSSQRSTTNLAQYSRSKGVHVPASRAGAARAAAILLIPCHLQASSKPSDSDVANRSRNDESDAQETDKENSSRPGSRRPSITSIKSTTSSQRSMSYSARRFELENQQKEQRAAMRAAREEAARHAAPPTPSPLSTDELIPACAKIEEDDPLGYMSSKAAAAAAAAASSKTGTGPELSPSGGKL